MDAWPETTVYGADGYRQDDRRAARAEAGGRVAGYPGLMDASPGGRRSFMDHARGRPGLTIETSNPPTLGPSAFSPNSPDEEYAYATAHSAGVTPSRTDSVAVKSPLQKLEVALGDVSKEAKRAKLEEVEQAVERRRSESKRTNVTSPISQSTARNLQRVMDDEDPGALNISKSRPKKQDNSYVSRDRQASLGDREATLSRGGSRTNPSSMRFSRTNSQSRQQGYNAMLSGAAAAAAVNAYQFSRGHRSGDFEDGEVDYPVPANSSKQASNKPVSRSASQPVPSSRQTTTARPQQQTAATGPQVPPQELGRSNTTDMSGSRDKSQGDLAAHPAVRPRQTSDGGTQQAFQYRRVEGPSAASTVPSAAATQSDKRQVAFDNKDPSVINAPNDETHGRHRVSNMLFRSPGKGRRYQNSEPALDEWKKASIATLPLTNSSSSGGPPEQNQKDLAWWERGSPQSASKSRAQGTSRSGLPQNLESTVEGDGQTFTPAISLKCGPLLRFTGIRNETRDNTSGAQSRFWNGSIMIVTEDSKSMYHPSPRLRLFQQARQLLDAQNHPPPLSDGTDHSPVDPLAGEMKLSRTGQPIYIKPVSMIEPARDLSRIENESGLFTAEIPQMPDGTPIPSRLSEQNTEKQGQFQEVQGFRLHAERGFTFWRFNIRVELGPEQQRIAYKINHGPAVGFWVPAAEQSMNIMFHSCNGFSLSVDSDDFSGPDPLWRDVMSQHQSKPFHVMIGGGDQIYNDAAMRQTELFQEWLSIKNPEKKHSAQFTEDMQDELEIFYFDRYAMWFSQGLFSLANSQIPMVNLWDDHDIIDGFGSYPHHFMSSPVFTGVGAVAYKYYMLFQHQSVPEETTEHEPSWLLGASTGPYIDQLSRSIFLSLGQGLAFLGLDCRTERMRDEILSQETWDLVFDRCRRELRSGETKHLLVLLGVPIAYPRLNLLENLLTSRLMDPIKALGRAGLMGNLMNKFDGGVEILDDLDDHWTAKHHKHERNWFIQELQELAAEKSVRITILGGDVHLAAVGHFYSNKKLGIPKDRDHRYMPNIISSAIVNTPPPEMMADILNKRNKVHHLDHQTDEHMIPLFTHDVNGKPRNNKHLLPRRNWCSIREYIPGNSPLPSPPQSEFAGSLKRSTSRSSSLSRSSSIVRTLSIKGNLVRKLTRKNANNPPSSFKAPNEAAQQSSYSVQSDLPPNTNSYFDGNAGYPTDARHSFDGVPGSGPPSLQRSDSFRRRPSDFDAHSARPDTSGRDGHIDLEGSLHISIHCEIDQHDPSGATTPYEMIVPALFYQDEREAVQLPARGRGSLKSFFGSFRRGRSQQRGPTAAPAPIEPTEQKPIETDHRDAQAQTHDLANSRGLGLSDVSHSNSGHDDYPVAQRQYPRSDTRSATAQALARASATDPAGVGDDAKAFERPSTETDDRQQPRQAHDMEHHPSVRGPRAPRNIEQLPSSVQKRYSQFEIPEETGQAGASRHTAEQSITEQTDPSSGHAQLPGHTHMARGSQRSSSSQQQHPAWNVPSTGLTPPLGKVNNRFDLTPTEAEIREQEETRQRRKEATQRAQRELEETERRRSGVPIDTTAFIAPAAHRHSVRSRRGSQRNSHASQVPVDGADGKAPPRSSTYHTPPTSAKQVSPGQNQAQFPSPLSSAPVTERDVAHARSASQSSEQYRGNHQRGASQDDSHADHHAYMQDDEDEEEDEDEDEDVSDIRSWSASPSPPPGGQNGHSNKHGPTASDTSAAQMRHHEHDVESATQTPPKKGGFSKLVRRFSGQEQ